MVIYPNSRRGVPLMYIRSRKGKRKPMRTIELRLEIIPSRAGELKLQREELEIRKARKQFGNMFLIDAGTIED